MEGDVRHRAERHARNRLGERVALDDEHSGRRSEAFPQAPGEPRVDLVGDHVSRASGQKRGDRPVTRPDLEHEVPAGDPRKRYELLCERPIAEEVL